MSEGIEQEIRQVEEMVASQRPLEMRPEAARGKLAELYLNDTNRPDRVPAARTLAEDALNRLTQDDPLYPKCEHILARALRALGPPETDGDIRSSRAARLSRDCFERLLDTAPQEALHSARSWGHAAWTQERWSEAAEAYESAETALRRQIRRETTELSDRVQRLITFRDQAPRAAFAHAMVDRPTNAAVALEQAAYLLLSHGEQSRDLRELAACGHADLTERVYATLQARSAIPATPDGLGRRSPAWRAAQQANDDAVNEIRLLPGWERFATGPDSDDIKLAAQNTALAYLAATDKGTVIVVVRQGADAPVAYCADCTAAEIDDALRPFILREFGDDPGDEREALDDDPSDEREALDDALGWLGLHLMFPVHRLLGGDTRVTLIPVGLLANYPLHAAQIRIPATADSPLRMHVLFHPSNISYAYSARTLHSAAHRHAQTPSGRALVVNNPGPLNPRYNPLELGDFEKAAVAAYFDVHELAGSDAVTGAVLEALPGVDVAHFICHGQRGSSRNYSGELLLAGQETLTAEQFAWAADLTQRLIVLSACNGAAAALGPASAVSLPAMMIAAGARAVLATLWRTDEMATLLLISRFYHLWRAGRGHPAEVALGLAQQWLITSTASQLRAACPLGALENPAGAELAQTAPDVHIYSDAWYWAAFILVGDG